MTEAAAYDTSKAQNDLASFNKTLEAIIANDGRTREQVKEDEALIKSIRVRAGDDQANAMATVLSGQSEDSMKAKRDSLAQAIINIASEHGIILAAGKASKTKAAGTKERKPRSSTPFDPAPFIAKVQKAMKQMKKGQEYKKSEVLKLAGISNDELTAIQWGEVGRPAGLAKLGTAGAGTRWGIE